LRESISLAISPPFFFDGLIALSNCPVKRGRFTLHLLLLEGMTISFYLLPLEGRIFQPSLLPLEGEFSYSHLLPLEGGGLRWGW